MVPLDHEETQSEVVGQIRQQPGERRHQRFGHLVLQADALASTGVCLKYKVTKSLVSSFARLLTDLPDHFGLSFLMIERNHAWRFSGAGAGAPTTMSSISLRSAARSVQYS